jgi:hypothetical protein
MNQDMHVNKADGMVCSCKCHSMMPIIVVIFGLLFLLSSLGVIPENIVSIVWPLIVIWAGVSKFMQKRCKCC